jgi:hypothetical protein
MTQRITFSLPVNPSVQDQVIDAINEHETRLDDVESGVPGGYWIDVKVEHDAAGDGVTDDSTALLAAFQAAADAVTAGTGEVVVFIPPGIYNVNRHASSAYSIDLPGSGYTIVGVRGQSWIRHPSGMPNAQVAMFRIDSKSDITIRDLGFDGNWGNAVTTIDNASQGQDLSASNFTLTVLDTTGFPSSGTIKVITPSGTTSVTYTGKTSTTFTTCNGGTGIAHLGYKVGYLDANTGINHTTQADPKNHAVMIRGSSNIRIENCDFKQTYGDGVWIGRAADDDPTKPARDVHIVGCTFNISARNGVTMGSAQKRIWIERCRFDNIFTTCIDSEPQSMSGYSRDVFIDRNYIGGWFNQAGGGGNNNLISCVGGWVVGHNQQSQARGWRITDNFIAGCTMIFTASDIVMRNNRIVLDYAGGTPRAPIFIDHSVNDITIDGNYIYDNADLGVFASHIHDGAIQCQFYSGGHPNNAPASVKITRNQIHARKLVNGIFIDGVGGFSRDDATPVIVPATGTATSVTSSTLVHTLAGWTVNQYEGWEVVIGGVRATVTSNTSDTLTLVVPPLAATAWHTPLGTPTVTPSTGTYVITSMSGMCEISDNEIDCGADGNAAGGYGIFLYNDRAGGRISVRNNRIKNATDYGIRVTGAAAKPILFLEMVDNKVWDDQPSATTTAAIRFSNAESSSSVGKLIMRGNTIVGGVTTLLSNVSAGTWLVSDGTAPVWTGYNTPEGAVTAGIGAMFLRLDGSTSTTLYVKTSGTGNTGWTAK